LPKANEAIPAAKANLSRMSVIITHRCCTYRFHWLHKDQIRCLSSLWAQIVFRLWHSML